MEHNKFEKRAPAKGVHSVMPPELLLQAEQRLHAIARDLSSPQRISPSRLAAAVSHNTELLHSVRAALARLAEGSYGTCAECHNRISERRLAAVPHAIHCLDCEQKLEREMLAARAMPLRTLGQAA